MVSAAVQRGLLTRSATAVPVLRTIGRILKRRGALINGVEEVIHPSTGP